MKQGRLLGLVLLMSLAHFPLWADEYAQRLESIVLETFDSPTERTWMENGKEMKETREWMVVGSKFSTFADRTKYANEIPFPRKAFPAVWPAALFDTNPDGLDLKAMGIQGRFDRKGYNYIEIYPAKQNEDGDMVAYSLPLPGIVKSIDMWVWGSMYKYSIELHIRDANGIPFILNLGSLWYQGWRNLKVNVPTHIPQMQQQVPRYKGLTLTKIVIRTDPSERVDNFYVYLDHMKILTDLHQNPFDGRDLIRPEFLDRTWNTN